MRRLFVGGQCALQAQGKLCPKQSLRNTPGDCNSRPAFVKKMLDFFKGQRISWSTAAHLLSNSSASLGQELRISGARAAHLSNNSRPGFSFVVAEMDCLCYNRHILADGHCCQSHDEW